ncbi:copper amine oxidase N-terminal domain-containing protein [Paenibacillus terrigena]|uniref:copper amine oxidase N-terminal domain-containing protein n=1 Tax=Paenibacillus terrigena TaxID=369333 RepID=UPI0028D4F902|nr:copper amine oxidase N-terminal domain-containing protein [Paenibacillus terrigena]
MHHKRKMSFRILTAALIAAMALSVPVAASAAGAAQVNKQVSSGIKVVLNDVEFQPKSTPFIENGVLYMPLRDTGELLGTVVFWNSTTKVITMTYPDQFVKLNYGSTQALVNGKPVELKAKLRLVDGRMYVPLRFFSEAIGAGVAWSPSTSKVTITKSNDFVKYETGSTCWMNRKTGDLYYAHPYEQPPVHVGKMELDHPMQGIVSIEEMSVNSGARIITVVDNYGEPHVNYDVYSVLLVNKKIVTQKKASYFQRYESNARYYQSLDSKAGKWIEHLLMTDGKILSVYNDQGQLVQEFDLPKLAGQDDVYTIEGIGDDYLLVRPNKTGLLMLIDLNDHSVVVLCDKLLTGQELDYAHNNDVPYRGDDLQYHSESADGDLIYFTHYSPFDGKHHLLTYHRKSVN